MPTRPAREFLRRVATSKSFQAALVIGSLVLAATMARHALSTKFAAYDDEGYFLLMADRYLGGSHLYTEVFSQYGPFYLFAQGALYRWLHLTVSHDGGRVIVLILWLASVALGAYFVYRVSKNATLSAAAALACVLLGRVLSNEPGHPNQWIFPILMAACCASLFVGRGPVAPLLLGALGAALLFTKINVGGLYLAALSFALICRFPAGRIRSACVWALVAFAAASPLILMRQNLFGWAQGYALLASICGFTTFVVGSLAAPPSPRALRDFGFAAAGAFLISVSIVLGAVSQGMSFGTLLDGIVRAPLKHPGVFAIPLEISGINVLIALATCGCILWLYARYGAVWPHPDWVDSIRCITGIVTIAVVSTYYHKSHFFIPFLPLGLIPSKERRASDYTPRIFVAALAATQFLQAYPVAGSQQGTAAAPLMLWAFICVHDGAGGLFRVLGNAAAWIGETVPGETILGTLLTLAFAGLMSWSDAWSWRYDDPPSQLRGAGSLRMHADKENRYEFLAGNIRANCDLLFTLPGMGSLNIWSGVPTPNGMNLTAWVKGFSPQMQQTILDRLQADTRACAVFNPELSGFWGVTPNDLAASTLARYITQDMVKVAEIGAYEIRVHPQRTSPWNRGAPPKVLAGSD